MNSTKDTQDANMWSKTMRITVVFLTAVVLAGLALIVFSEFFAGVFI